VDLRKDHRLTMLNGALKDELGRSKQKLQDARRRRPVLHPLLWCASTTTTTWARAFGAIFEDSYQNVRQASVEVRVGSYQFDNTADDSAEKAFDLDDFDRYEPPTFAPIDNNVDAMRATLWLQTDARYKQALAALHKKRGTRVTKMVEDEKMPSFSREKAASGRGSAGDPETRPRRLGRPAAPGVRALQDVS
jgi:hypothetical protein